MMDDNDLIPGPLDPQLPETTQPSAADLDAAAQEQEAAQKTLSPPPPFCGYPVLRDGRWVPCGQEATDGCAYCDEHGIPEAAPAPPAGPEVPVMDDPRYLEAVAHVVSAGYSELAAREIVAHGGVALILLDKQFKEGKAPASYAELQANVEGAAPQVQQSEIPNGPMPVTPPSLTHHAACGVVGETGAHGDLGSNAIDYVGPHRPETMPKE